MNNDIPDIPDIVRDALSLIRLMSATERSTLKLEVEVEIECCPTCWSDGVWCCRDDRWGE